MGAVPYYFLSDGRPRLCRTPADRNAAADVMEAAGDPGMAPYVRNLKARTGPLEGLAVPALFVNGECVAVMPGYPRTIEADGEPISGWYVWGMFTRPDVENRGYMSDLTIWVVLDGPAWELGGRLLAHVQAPEIERFIALRQPIDELQRLIPQEDGSLLVIGADPHGVATHPWTLEHRPGWARRFHERKAE